MNCLTLMLTLESLHCSELEMINGLFKLYSSQMVAYRYKYTANYTVVRPFFL